MMRTVGVIRARTPDDQCAIEERALMMQTCLTRGLPGCLVALFCAVQAVPAATDDTGREVVLDERFAGPDFRKHWLLEGIADLDVREEGGRRFLHIQTQQSPRDKQLHHSVLWYRDRLEGDLRFEFRARAQVGNGTIFYFNARRPDGSSQSPFDPPRPDALEERYSGSKEFEAYTLGYLRSPTLNLRHVGGATSAAWPNPWTKENSARYDRESIFANPPSPFGKQCDTWHDFDVSVTGDRIRILVDGQQVIDHRDSGKSPEGTLAWKPLLAGGWIGFRNFTATWVDIESLRVSRIPHARDVEHDGRTRRIVNGGE
ncbi:MAG: family 16 glycoside hydrolase [Planctomycetota bacterium]